ncbi:MAG: ATP synthase F1 subunit delta [Planctomycetes bacterium]|nr:ATP synthase F1 subunit delta [Planctomycetota bacterium]
MATNVSDPVARMYAGALIEIGRQHGNVGAIHDGLKVIAEAWKDEGFHNFFVSPRVSKEAKGPALVSALKGKVCTEVLNLVQLIVKKRREPLFDNIVRAFDRFKDQAEGRVHAFVEAGSPFDAAEFEALKAALSKASGGKEVELHVHNMPDLIGGARIRMGDLVIDTTLKRRLSKLARQFNQGNP